MTWDAARAFCGGFRGDLVTRETKPTCSLTSLNFIYKEGKADRSQLLDRRERQRAGGRVRGAPTAALVRMGTPCGASSAAVSNRGRPQRIASLSTNTISSSSIISLRKRISAICEYKFFWTGTEDSPSLRLD
ncbi:uncharacterized protein LOC119573607 [Penaeus monodon]|uniref:uncharacterized protein LOC119573607 n=1 Tax=Penaeus monodon TaxID=6687 RepID=UPI0018A742BB|nr:uncharacterized protein LOC119573607 [Penaeus monodon]